MSETGTKDQLAGYLDATEFEDAALVARAERMGRAVASQFVEGPSDGFFDHALDAAAREGSRDRRSRSFSRGWGIGVGSALVAGVAMWLVAGLLLKAPELSAPDAIAGLTIAMTMNETRRVNLMFASTNDLQDATLVVQLPTGVEVEGYAGRSEIRWSTQLQKGRNVLPLELVAISGNGGELIARVEHQSKQKTFRLNVSVT